MHPQSNGRAERQVREVITYLRKYLTEGTNENKWESLLPALQFAYNSSMHSSKGYSPYMIAFTRRPRVATSLLEETRRQYNEGGFVESLRLFQRITRDVLGADSD